MTLRDLFKKLRAGDSVEVIVTVLGYTEKTKRYYSFYTYYKEWGLNKKYFEDAENNILDCEVEMISAIGCKMLIDVVQYVPEEALEEEEP